MKARTSEMNRKIPAHHQVILVSKLVACRPPMNCSVPAPPPSDASPPPWPACSNTAVVRIRASRVRRISRKLYMRPGKYLGSAGLHKLRPAFGIERGAAHQDAIELAFGEEGGGVLRVHTSAVEDPRRRSASACEPAADLPVDRGGVVGGRVAAGADRPHRLVRDHDARQRPAVETAQRGGKLADDHRQRVPRVALRERFSDAQHRPGPRPERRAHFATSVFVGLAEQVASLGMADQRDASSSLERERGGNRTGERAFRLPVDVLDTHQEVAALARRLGGGFDRDRGREEPHLAVLPAVVAGPERLQIGSGFIQPDVHFPISGEQQSPHASSRAATPGSGLPSRNSSAAPPPVETWVSLSSSPATAAAESPPPTTVVAPRFPASIRASPMARVPASYGGGSHTALGAVQKTVLAFRIRARKSSRVGRSMSKMAQSPGMRSLDTSWRSAARARLGATTAPRGRISLAPPLARSSFATSSLSRSTSEPPTWNPIARKNVFAIAPPMRISSTLGSSAWMTSIFPEIFAPPSTATNGRLGCSSASPR